MRVTLLVPTLEIGGVERVFTNLANGLHQCGAEVEIVAGWADGKMALSLERNIRVFDLRSRRMIKSIPRLARYLRTRKPEAVIAAMTHCSAAAVAARAISGQKTMVIGTEHNTMSRIRENTAGLKYRLMPQWSRWALGSADVIVAVSSGVADDLSAQTGIARESIRVIYNPVISDTLRSAATVKTDHPWFQPGEPPVILGVGRLDRQKDFSMLVRAFRIVRERRTARLVILGEGPDRREIERTIADNGLLDDVALPGSEVNPYRFMKHSALLAMSSRWEGFGVVLVEALALGVPVVSTNCTHGPAEILCDGRFGALVPVGDEKAMAQSLLLTLDNPLRCDDAVHLEKFSIRAAALSYLSLVAQRRNISLSSAVGC
jgi:glycosyltransferase involved in cell wall biosynthesis